MSDDSSTGASTLKLFMKATTGVMNVATLGAAAAGAAALQSWPILAIGGAAYGALVAWDLTSKEFRERVLGKGKPQLADPATYTDTQTRNSVRALRAAKLEIARTLEAAGPEVQGHLAVALTTMDELHTRASGLAARGEELGRYLATVDARVVDQDVTAIEERLSRARDESAKETLRGALAARKEHVQAIVDLLGAKERIDATLLNIVATLEGLPAKIVRMAAVDAEAMDSLTGDVQEELAQMNGEIRTFEETLRAIGEVGR